MAHFKEICFRCNKVVNQCRCPGVKNLYFTMCDECIEKEKNDTG